MAENETKWTPGPWVLSPNGTHVRRTLHGFNICTLNESLDTDEVAANARLIAAAPNLRREAAVLRCLASSPRFQGMTVAAALAELAENGCGHDDGAALAKAEGK